MHIWLIMILYIFICIDIVTTYDTDTVQHIGSSGPPSWDPPAQPGNSSEGEKKTVKFGWILCHFLNTHKHVI